ncbi:MAG: hypothetical protein ACRD9L_19275 [Bryobacteraceae bacterium]
MKYALFPALIVTAAWAIEKPPPAPPPPPDTPADVSAQLLKVRRVFVDRLSGGPTAEQIRDMIIAALQASKLFVLTENEERADAYLRGSAEDLVFTDTYSYSDSTNARGSSSSRSNNSQGGGGTYDRWSAAQGSGRSGSMGVGQSESEHTQERRHEATATVRLVNRDGDVIWSSTEESLGGKFHGSSADVANKITKQLVGDYNRLKNPPSAARPVTPQAVSTAPSATK